MPIATKVFSGSAAAGVTTTIYTVPAGRLARVRIAAINGNTATAGVVLALGSQSGLSIFGRFPVVWRDRSSTTGTYPAVTGENTIVGKLATGAAMEDFCLPYDSYLVAGETVQISGGTTGTVSYQFLVTEEAA